MQGSSSGRQQANELAQQFEVSFLALCFCCSVLCEKESSISVSHGVIFCEYRKFFIVDGA